ncbi:MAG: tetratricopeptide repeat protein [Flavobacteriales bacterium]|nr:tetratricopeptide repeat protein [Flavobacteriales bacterium]
MAKKKDQEEVIVDVNEVYTKTELFVDRNRKTLVTVLVAIVAVVLIGAAYFYLMVKPAENDANADSWKAEQYFEVDSLDLAMIGDGLYAGLEDVASDHDGTKAGARAHYDLAIIARDRGDFETALDHFEKVSLSDDVVSVLAQGGIGDCHVELGNYEEGAKAFERAAAMARGTNAEGFTAPMMLYKAGIAQMELGQNDKAAKNFKKVVDNYPEAQVHGRAQRYAAYLGKK